MRRHPTVDIPNIGPKDHAWDLLGEWTVDFEVPGTDERIHGKVQFQSWSEGELFLEPWGAAEAGVPEYIPLERASKVHLTDAGGGALQWVMLAPTIQWTLQATLWPGALYLFVHEGKEDDDREEYHYRLAAGRTRQYYHQKYPLVQTT